VVRVELADGSFDDGSGGSKRVAEQAAARAALERLARESA
jgi:dsRNA-specific ribonuclease